MSRRRKKAEKARKAAAAAEGKKPIEGGEVKLPELVKAPANPVKELIDAAFNKKAEPVVVEDPKELYMFQCPNQGCGGVHFRHAGYIEMLMPYITADKAAEVAPDPHQVKVCCKCWKCYIWVKGQVYDVSKHIDLAAWKKTEVKAQEATGPGGDC